MTYHITLLTFVDDESYLNYWTNRQPLTESWVNVVDGLTFVSGQGCQGVRICREVFTGLFVSELIEQALDSGCPVVFYGELRGDQSLQDYLDDAIIPVWSFVCGCTTAMEGLKELEVVDTWYLLINNVNESPTFCPVYWTEIYKPLLNFFEGIDLTFSSSLTPFTLK